MSTDLTKHILDLMEEKYEHELRVIAKRHPDFFPNLERDIETLLINIRHEYGEKKPNETKKSTDSTNLVDLMDRIRRLANE